MISALPSKADIAKRYWDVRFVPKADICSAAKVQLVHFASMPPTPLVIGNITASQHRGKSCRSTSAPDKADCRWVVFNRSCTSKVD
jgi:hypothetical protein